MKLEEYHVQVLIHPDQKESRVKHRSNTVHENKQQRIRERKAAAEAPVTACLQGFQSDKVPQLCDDLSEDAGLRVKRANMDATWSSGNGTRAGSVGRLGKTAQNRTKKKEMQRRRA